MKLNKWILAATIAGSVLAIQSCSKISQFGDINSNPNLTTNPNTAALLTNVLSGLANTVWGGNASLTVTDGLYGQYNSETQYTDASRYATPSINWDGFYSGPLYDLQNIILYNGANPGDAKSNGDNQNQIAIARIMKVWYFWMLTDNYGDLPYFNSLKGTTNLAYDGQDKIYADLIKELKEAVVQFVTPTTVFKGDILYNGDFSKWKKFANSMRMLIALRMSKKSPATSQTEFLSALNDPAGIITSNADNASLAYPGGIYNHPLYQYYVITQRFDYALSKTVTDILTGTSDNRQTAYGLNTTGFPYGLDRSSALAFATANPNLDLILSAANRAASSPMNLISAANVYLARAEAANLGWGTDNAASMYSLGIQSSWQQWGVYDAPSFTTYIAQSSIALSAGNAASKIGTQAWLAWFPNGWQAWSTWRKTGYPVLTPAPQIPVLPIIRRIPYGPLESQLNPTNYNTAAATYTVAGVPNSQNAKVWWDN